MGMSTKQKRERAVLAETLHTTNVHMASCQHEVWRACNTLSDGLTEREQAYLQKRHDELAELVQKISKFNRHVKRGL